MRTTAWLTPLVLVAIAAAQQETPAPTASQAQSDSSSPPASRSPVTTPVSAKSQTAAEPKEELARQRHQEIPALTKPAALKPYNLDRPWVKTSRERIAESRRRLWTEVGQMRTKTWELRQVFIPNNTEAPPSKAGLGARATKARTPARR